MDKTKTYIKMSDCPEIQEGWKPKDGDVFFDEDLYKNAKKLKHKINFDLSHKALGVVAKGNFVCDHCNEENDLYPFDKFYPQDDVIWLPQQGNIQKMFFTKECELGYDMSLGTMYVDWRRCSLFESFFNFYRSAYAMEFKSMEQLWLAFYMHEKHGKIWKGEEWMEVGHGLKDNT